MPYIFLNEKTIAEFREVVMQRIRYIEEQRIEQETVLNDLGNTIDPKEAGLPEKIEMDYHVVDDTGTAVFADEKLLEKHIDKQFEPDEKLCGCGDELQTAEDEERGKCGICQAVEPLSIPEKLKGLGKQAIKQNAAQVEQKPVKCDNLRIPAFSFDKKKMTSYQTIFFFEDEDERVAIQYREATYYSTIPFVRLLPYPPPKMYYSGNGWNTASEQAFKQYRKYLAEQDEKNDPDRGYKFKLKTDTKGNHGEDYEKIEGEI